MTHANASKSASAGTEKTLPEMIADSWACELPDLSHRGLQLTLRIRALALVIDHELARSAEAEGIQVDDVLLLSALRRTGPPYQLRPTEIFGLLNITSGAATARIARLVNKGLADRVNDPGDRRSQLVQISFAGAAVIDRIMATMAQVSDLSLDAGGLDTTQLRKLKAGLRLLERGWETVVPEAENPLTRENVARRR